jgi:ArsR family transcriptional regulator
VKELPLIECCAPLGGPSLSESETEELERLFGALADRHRVRILNLLLQADDAVCVCNLVPVLGLSQPTVSYHLKQLTQAGLLERERRGTFAYYRARPEAFERLSGLLGAPVSALAS